MAHDLGKEFVFLRDLNLQIQVWLQDGFCLQQTACVAYRREVPLFRLLIYMLLVNRYKASPETGHRFHMFDGKPLWPHCPAGFGYASQHHRILPYFPTESVLTLNSK